MNMKDVKAITIPEGTVKKIEDANGNIIWGSQAAFPYRRLRYILLSNGYWKDTSRNFDGTWGCAFTGEITNAVSQMAICGTQNGGSTSNLIIYNSAGSEYGSRYAGGTATYTSSHTVDYPNFKAYVGWSNRIRVRVYDGTGTAVEIKDTPQVTYTLNSSFPNLMIHNYATAGGSLATGIGAMRLYTYDSWLGTSEEQNPSYKWIPCQRKSDGALGMYDVKHNNFIAATGQTATDIEVVDEYWDLTA